MQRRTNLLARAALRVLGLVLLVGPALSAACADSPGEQPLPTRAASAASVAPPTSAGGADGPVASAEPAIPLPTPTPADPIVALVNGQPIHESAYRREIALLEANALGIAVGDRPLGAMALDTLVDRALIEQAAVAMGVVVDQGQVDAQYAALVEAAANSGGQGAFEAWLASNQLTEVLFRDLLYYELLTSAVAAQVTADVPFAAEHVRARYIQVADPALAQQLVTELANGVDFAALAQLHSLDAVTAQVGGDLGFFAQGMLLVPEVETAAFALQPGEVSPVIAVAPADGGPSVYYLVQTIERDPSRPLTADVRNALLVATYEQWLADLRASAAVEVLVDIGS